ncbi:hypothetical protein BHAP_0310 [Bifidobacterium hapali]|uniref:Uncharacterized protein n=1 Tax=Bifidobacterium hapali TaxID=1630172 RepID=A0A261G4W7_9BIFI|nr:hypothetical protein BHAP_0310 [Bifidobacterium hapali]
MTVVFLLWKTVSIRRILYYDFVENIYLYNKLDEHSRVMVNPYRSTLTHCTVFFAAIVTSERQYLQITLEQCVEYRREQPPDH